SLGLRVSLHIALFERLAIGSQGAQVTHRLPADRDALPLKEQRVSVARATRVDAPYSDFRVRTSGHAQSSRMSSAGREPTILSVSRLTVTTRWNSSSGYFGLPIVSMAQSLASLTMPLALSTRTAWRSITQSSAALPLTT